MVGFVVSSLGGDICAVGAAVGISLVGDEVRVIAGSIVGNAVPEVVGARVTVGAPVRGDLVGVGKATGPSERSVPSSFVGSGVKFSVVGNLVGNKPLVGMLEGLWLGNGTSKSSSGVLSLESLYFFSFLECFFDFFEDFSDEDVFDFLDSLESFLNFLDSFLDFFVPFFDEE